MEGFVDNKFTWALKESENIYKWRKLQESGDFKSDQKCQMDSFCIRNVRMGWAGWKIFWREFTLSHSIFSS
jgi:hypothetical protein